jgi:antibiotic biosynthesis monooxygenase (ABM) superfamily enzyme
MKTNKWKLGLLVWSAMFPFSTIISYALAQLPFMAHWPLMARTFCLTCLLVPYMVCVALPFLTRRFQKWIQVTPDRGDTEAIQQQILPNQSGEIHVQTGSVPSSRQYALL